MSGVAASDNALTTRGALQAIVGVAMLLLTACGDPSGDVDEVSEECRNAMREAAAEPDSSRAEPLLARTLRVCDDVDEWLRALQLHPAAMGVASAEHVGEVDVRAACGGTRYAATAVCRDARDRGFVD